MNEVIAAFFIIIASGLIFRIVKPNNLVSDELKKSINSVVFNLFLPALCIKVMLTSPLSKETLLVPLNSVLTLLVMIVVNYLIYNVLSKPLNLNKSEIGALVLTSTFGNTTYLGLPIITGLYGDSYARFVLYYDLLAMTPFLWTVGARVSASLGGQKSLSILESIKKIFTLPPLWGIVIGIFLHLSGIPVPKFFIKALDMLGAVVVPLMIFSIGLSLSFIKVAHTLSLVPVCILKLFISPLVGYWLGKIVGLEGTILNIVTLEAAMPSMVLSLLVAGIFNLNVTLTAMAIVITTILSFISLPIILKMLTFFA